MPNWLKPDGFLHVGAHIGCHPPRANRCIQGADRYTWWSRFLGLFLDQTTSRSEFDEALETSRITRHSAMITFAGTEMTMTFSVIKTLDHSCCILPVHKIKRDIKWSRKKVSSNEKISRGEESLLKELRAYVHSGQNKQSSLSLLIYMVAWLCLTIPYRRSVCSPDYRPIAFLSLPRPLHPLLFLSQQCHPLHRLHIQLKSFSLGILMSR
ncbi:hypothetical protein J6590_047503 [Homalodisca vitripennis]|nr:hypothetical protein J6590_047503 [Homalodisca vitripennis]